MVTDTRHRVGVYGWHSGRGGIWHLRVHEPIRVLAGLGCTAFAGATLSNEILDQVDTVVAHTLHGEDETEAWHALADLDSHRLVIDIDDAMWRPDFAPFKAHYTPYVLKVLRGNVERAHVVTTTTDLLADYLEAWNPNVHVVPNTVPAWLLGVTMPPRAAPTVGFQGSSHHERDWTESQRAQLARFLGRHRDWHVATWGPVRFDLVDAPHRSHHTPWVEGWENYFRVVSMDVGVGPLRDTYFNRCKSALRAIEYAALGIVAVLPDLPTYRGWVSDGVTGRLIRSHQTLSGVLHEVAVDPGWRARASHQARHAATMWTTEANIERWVTAWASR